MGLEWWGTGASQELAGSRPRLLGAPLEHGPPRSLRLSTGPAMQHVLQLCPVHPVQGLKATSQVLTRTGSGRAPDLSPPVCNKLHSLPWHCPRWVPLTSCSLACLLRRLHRPRQMDDTTRTPRSGATSRMALGMSFRSNLQGSGRHGQHGTGPSAEDGAGWGLTS